MNSSPEFKLRDAGSYDEVAGDFDELSRRYNAAFADRLIEIAAIRSGDAVLDVATGTGLCALAAAGPAGAAGRVLGVDLSEGMLDLARRKASQQAPSVEFRRMDAEALELPDASFDVVVSLFALLHFPAPERALGEMRRVLKPGGRIAIAAGSGPPLFSRFALKRVVALLAGALRRAPELRAPQALDALLDRALPAHGREETSLAGYGHARAGRIDSLVRAAGLAVRKTHWESLTSEIRSPEEFWDVQRTFSSRARKRLAAASPAEAAAARASLIESARRVQAAGGRLVYTRAAFFVVAARPAEA